MSRKQAVCEARAVVVVHPPVRVEVSYSLRLSSYCICRDEQARTTNNQAERRKKGENRLPRGMCHWAWGKVCGARSGVSRHPVPTEECFEQFYSFHSSSPARQATRHPIPRPPLVSLSGGCSCSGSAVASFFAYPSRPAMKRSRLRMLA